jgi:hypothetical protein
MKAILTYAKFSRENYTVIRPIQQLVTRGELYAGD